MDVTFVRAEAPRDAMTSCPICYSPDAVPLTERDGFPYFRCAVCECLFIAPAVLDEIDRGRALVEYSDAYWCGELHAARERAFGASLARLAEVFYYARIPIYRFLDIGTGPGFLLDAVRKYLPEHCGNFYGIEKFPPPDSLARTREPNYLVGDVGDLKMQFDGGMCMEVIEHLTPKMLVNLLRSLSKIVSSGASFIINTGMPDYVLNEDMNYLDPLGRGHIVSYSLNGLNILAKPHGFVARPIPGKTWACLLEHQAEGPEFDGDLRKRIWNPVAHNMDILSDREMGTVLKILGLETSRAYSLQA